MSEDTQSGSHKQIAAGGSRWRSGWFIALAAVLFIVLRSEHVLAIPAEFEHPQMIRTGLAILAAIAVLWLTEALPLAATAVMVPVLAALTGVLDVTSSFANFAHPLIFLFLGGFALAAGLARHSLDRWLAQGALRLGKGHFYRTAAILFGIAAVLSMWISNTAATAMLVPVALGIRATLIASDGQKAATRTTPFLLLGLAYSASIGGLGTVIGTPPNAIAAAKLGLSFTDWLAIGMPCVAILLPTLFLMLLVVLHPGKVGTIKLVHEKLKMTGQAWGMLVLFAAVLTCWLCSRQLGAFFGISKDFDSLIAVAAIGAMAATRLIGWRDIEKTTDWGVLLLFGGGLTLSKILSTTQASLYLANGVRDLTAGWPLIAVVGVLVLFVIFLTELSSNTATTALLTPIFASVALDMGIEPARLVLPLAIASSCAFMLPVATPPNAIVFSSGLIQQKQMMRAGVVLNLVFAGLLTVLSPWLFGD